jgi:hypothetical protein
MRTLVLTLALLTPAGLCRADDVDPEPPGGNAVRKLQGKWQSMRRVAKGQETDFVTTSWVFEKDRAVCTFNGGQVERSTIRADRSCPQAILLTGESRIKRYFFKFEKGELYLSPDRTKDQKARPDFSGKVVTVIVLKKVK